MIALLLRDVFINSIVILNQGARYLGEWSKIDFGVTDPGDPNILKEERHGIGILVYQDGSIYEGEWANNKQNGNGRLIHKNKDVYIGNFVDDKADGEGVYYFMHDNSRYSSYSKYLCS